MEKITNAVKFANAIKEMQEKGVSAETIEFIQSRADAEAKRAKNRKSYKSKTQKENDPLLDAIVKFMEVGKAYTMTELMNTVPALKGYSSQKVNALLRTLRQKEKVTRIEDKKGVKFAVKAQ